MNKIEYSALVAITTMAAVIKFILDGVTLTLYGHTVNFGHMDAMTYTALLAPVLGAHAWMQTKGTKDDKIN